MQDARMKIISQNRSKVRDARDRLVKMAKTTDARAKLEKIRNLKEGKLDVKKTSKGGITITTTTKGEVVLTTRKKEGNKRASAPLKRAPTSELTKTFKRYGRRSDGANHHIANRAISAATNRRSPPRRKPMYEEKIPPLMRTIKGRMSESAKLDYELMNTKVNPVILKRTVRQGIRGRSYSPDDFNARQYRSLFRRSPMETDFYESRSSRNDRLKRRERSRSPIDADYGSTYASRRSRYEHEDSRRDFDREDDLRRRRMKDDDRMYSSRNSDPLVTRSNYVSPLQGAKIVVTNLQSSVTQEDIVELFGDIGPLKRAKVSNPGTAEVVFVNRDDAVKAVETYHNRQLDGRAMKCHLIGK